jgi:hypothetical protein
MKRRPETHQEQIRPGTSILPKQLPYQSKYLAAPQGQDRSCPFKQLCELQGLPFGQGMSHLWTVEKQRLELKLSFDMPACPLHGID